MIGYKSISELSIKECYDMLQNELDSLRKQVLEQRYNNLLYLWQEKDSQTFKSCSTIADYDDYIRQFDVYYYPIQHREDAYKAIQMIRQKDHERIRMQQIAQEEDFFWETHKNKYLRRQQYLSKYPNGKYKKQVKLFNILRSIVLSPLYFVSWLTGAIPWFFLISAFCIHIGFIEFLPIIVFFPLADIYNNDVFYFIGFGLFFPWMIGVWVFYSNRKEDSENRERKNHSKIVSWLDKLLYNLFNIFKEKMEQIKRRINDRLDSIL